MVSLLLSLIVFIYSDLIREEKNLIHSFFFHQFNYRHIHGIAEIFLSQSFEHIYSSKTRPITMSIDMVIRETYRLKMMTMTLVTRYKLYTCIQIWLYQLICTDIWHVCYAERCRLMTKPYSFSCNKKFFVLK
jgi:hypothetical protein